MPLKLSLKVVNANDCRPMKNVVVDIWHADAKGTYSGYKDHGVDTAGEFSKWNAGNGQGRYC